MFRTNKLWPQAVAMATAMSSSGSKVSIPKNGVDYRGKVVLAPMVRSGELPSRLMALRYGADLVWGPETVDRSMIGTTRRVNPRNSTIEFSRLSSNNQNLPADSQRESIIYRLFPAFESPRLIFQLGTASPEYAVQAAKLVASDVAGIDVNAGCPKPFSTSGGMGAALLSTPELLCEILQALVSQVGRVWQIGISVKIRLLRTEEETKELVKKLCQTGITGLTVHCRTRNMRKNERAIRTQLKMIGEVCRDAGVACLMNGDVESREEAEELAREYGVDGAMIATAAEKNPSVFRSNRDGGAVPWHEVLPEYLKIAMDVENKWGNTKFLLSQIMPGKAQNYRNITQANNYECACVVLDLHSLIPKARQVDKVLGITERETKSVRKAKKHPQLRQSNCSMNNYNVLKALDESKKIKPGRALQSEAEFFPDLHQDIGTSAVTA